MDIVSANGIFRVGSSELISANKIIAGMEKRSDPLMMSAANY